MSDLPICAEFSCDSETNIEDCIYEYKRATMEDIDELVRTRIIVLRAANKLSDDVDTSMVEKESLLVEV